MREAIVNAVVHRDYFSNGEVAVEKLKEKIDINNPGGLMFDKNKFGTTSIPRNKLIADLLSKTFYMEKVGTGIKRIERDCKQNNNHIEFDFSDDFFFSIYTSNNVEIKPVKATPKATPKTTLEKLLEILADNPKITREEMAKILGISINGVKQHILNLKRDGKLKRIGGRKIGHWEIVIKEK